MISTSKPFAVDDESPSKPIDLSEIQNPLVRKGLDVWHARKGCRRFPSRLDISPRDLSALLRNISLVRVVDGGADYEIRIVGDAVVLAQGVSFQGWATSKIEQFYPGFGRLLATVYARVFGSGDPAAYRGWFKRQADGRTYYHESLVLPLGADNDVIDHLLVIGAYGTSFAAG